MPCHETPACINNVYFPLLFRLTNYWKRFWTMLLRFCLSWCVLYARLGLHIIFCWFGEASFINFFFFLLEAQNTRAVKSRLVLVFHLIGWETDASCLIGWETDASCLIGWETDASCPDQSAVKHHQSKPELLSTENFPKPFTVCMFSIRLSIHFLRCWQREFVYQSKTSFVCDHYLYSHDLNVWFRGDFVGRNLMLVTLRV